ASLGVTVIDGGASPQRDWCNEYSSTAASPRGAPVRPCSMSLTAEGLRPMSAPITANVLPRLRRSATRDAQLLMSPSLRHPVDVSQRHTVTAFRDTMDMPKSVDIPRFDTLGARIVYWRQR